MRRRRRNVNWGVNEEKFLNYPSRSLRMGQDDYDKQLQQLRQLIKDLFTKTLVRSEELYYKTYLKLESGKSLPIVQHKQIDYSDVKLDELIKEIINKMLQPNVDYIIYVVYYYRVRPPDDESMTYEEDINPVRSCIEYKDYSETLRLLFDDFPVFFTGLESVTGKVSPKKINKYFTKGFINGLVEAGIRDPLEQIILYKNFKTELTFKPVYICGTIFENAWLGIPSLNVTSLEAYELEPHIIAYCTPLNNFVKLITSGDILRYNKLIDKIFDKALDKIKKSQELREMRKSLKKKEKWKACSKEVIEKIIRDEIDEANKIMRQYGIFRVVVTNKEMWERS